MFPPLPLAGDSVTFGEKIPLPISGEVILTVTKSPGWQLEGGRGQVLAWMSRGDMMTAKDTSRFISTLQEAHGPQRSVAFRCPLARTLAVVALSFNNHRYSNREFFLCAFAQTSVTRWEATRSSIVLEPCRQTPASRWRYELAIEPKYSRYNYKRFPFHFINGFPNFWGKDDSVLRTRKGMSSSGS